MEKTIKVDGMMCSHCENRVRKALEMLPEVESARVSHEYGRAILTLNSEINDEIIIKVIEDAGYEVKGIQ